MGPEPLNSLRRLRQRELCAAPPGAVVNSSRSFFENVVPSTEVKLEPPDCHIFKFTPSGEYLICTGHLQHDLVVYRYTGLQSEGGVNAAHLAPGSLSFDRFFRLLYHVNLANGTEALCRDCCLVLQAEEFALVASSSSHILVDPEDAEPEAVVPFVPLVAATTLHLVRLRTGEVLDTYVIRDDFVHLGHNGGVHLFGDIIVALGIRTQSIHVLQLRPSGSLLQVQVIGTQLRADDGLVLGQAREAEERWQAARLQELEARRQTIQARMTRDYAQHTHQQPPARGNHSRPQDMQLALPRPASREHLFSAGLPAHSAFPTPAAALAQAAAQTQLAGVSSAAVASVTGIPMGEARHALGPRAASPDPGPEGSGSPVMEGIKHAILAYIFRTRQQQAATDTSAMARFYFHFHDFMNLAMWKVQMLDPDHLLLALGPQDAAGARGIDLPSSGYIVATYCMSAGKIIDLHDHHSKVLMDLYLKHALTFYSASVCCEWDRFITPSAVTPHADSSHNIQAAKRGLSGMPAAAQMVTSSPYLDACTWQYDAHHITPLLRHRPQCEQPLRFASMAHPTHARFKVQPPEPPIPAAQPPGARMPKSMVVCHFHPTQPFVMCTQQTYGSPLQLSIQYRP